MTAQAVDLFDGGPYPSQPGNGVNNQVASIIILPVGMIVPSRKTKATTTIVAFIGPGQCLRKTCLDHFPNGIITAMRAISPLHGMSRRDSDQ